MVMAEYFTHDRLQELWQQIHHLHLAYLDTEDSPQKIDQRNKLEVCIRDYLCIAPHNQKFYCPETAEVLHRSASSKKDFSGYRAALAWNAVSMYAGNLLSQPWRKEYRTIKTYSGFYKHQIEANLVGAEAMFEAMGYKHVGDGILLLEGPVCPDRVSNVSQDSIVAFVECQIIKTIWEEVSNKFKINWLDVLEFRESHIYSPEESVRMLNYRLNERRYHEQQQPPPPQPQPQTSRNNSDTTYSTLLRYTIPAGVPQLLPGMHSFPPLSSHHPHPPQHPQQQQPPGYNNHHHMTPAQMCPGQCIYSNPYYNYNYAPAHHLPPPPINYHPRYGIPQHYSLPCTGTGGGGKPCNGYCYPTNGCVPPPAYICPVPTGQLIEFDSNGAHAHTHTHTHNGGYGDVVDSAATKRDQLVESHKQLAKSTNLDSLTLSKSKEDGAGTFESWDYVYRNLESQGYYKDLSERPDVLQQQQQLNEKKKNLKKTQNKPSIELENEFNNLHMVDHGNRTVKKNKENGKMEDYNNYKMVAQSNSCDNITQTSPEINHKPLKSISNGISKTLPRQQIVSPDKPISQTLDTKKLRLKDIDKVDKVDKVNKIDKVRLNNTTSNTSTISNTINGWNCNACTYLNKPNIEICVICGKSKNNVEVVMAVGGSQCPVCTLVNKREVENCEACNASLKNSPTYI